jgi:hypothetical protein
LLVSKFVKRACDVRQGRPDCGWRYRCNGGFRSFAFEPTGHHALDGICHSLMGICYSLQHCQRVGVQLQRHNRPLNGSGFRQRPHQGDRRPEGRPSQRAFDEGYVNQRWSFERYEIYNWAWHKEKTVPCWRKPVLRGLKMSQQISAYTARPNGPLVEILDLDGNVIAWAVDVATAQALVSLLNLAHVGGLLDPNHDTTE